MMLAEYATLINVESELAIFNTQELPS